MSPDEQIISRMLQDAEAKFRRQTSELHRIADLNRAAVEACVTLDQSDEQGCLLTAESVARAISQIALLKAPLLLLAGAYEDAQAMREAALR